MIIINLNYCVIFNANIIFEYIAISHFDIEFDVNMKTNIYNNHNHNDHL